MSKFLDKIATCFADRFAKDTSKMLIWTGVAGWTLSSIAQMGAVLFNPKFTKEEKSFMIPQEFADALANVGTFFIFTQATKKIANKLFTTGKIAPKSLHKYLNEHSIYKNQKGKLDFDLDKIVDPNINKYNYETYKNYGTTIATIGAGIISSNIITPIVRNKIANRMHENYLDAKTQNSYAQTYPKTYSSNLKI